MEGFLTVLMIVLLVISAGVIISMTIEHIRDYLEARKNKKNGTYKTVDLLDLHDKASYTTTRMIDLVSNLSITMASMSGDLEELKVRIEILENKTEMYRSKVDENNHSMEIIRADLFRLLSPKPNKKKKHRSINTKRKKK